MKFDFISVGGATRDICFYTDSGVLINNKKDILRQELLAFEHGAKIKIDKFHYSYGGGAANAAVNFANFGFKTACLTCVGDDINGLNIIKNFKDRRVSVKLIKKERKTDSGFSFILISQNGERVIFTSRGANEKLNISNRDLKNLKLAKNIYIASLSGAWEEDLKNIFTASMPGGPKISWNPGEAQYANGLRKISVYLKKTYVFAVNKDEAIELALSVNKYKLEKNSFFNNTKNLLKIIYELGPKIIVITDGKNGVDVYDGESFYHKNIKTEKKRVDTTGVGDIFNSSFVAGLEIFKGDINKSLDLGLKNTASKIAHLGAQNGLIKL